MMKNCPLTPEDHLLFLIPLLHKILVLIFLFILKRIFIHMQTNNIYL